MFIYKIHPIFLLAKLLYNQFCLTLTLWKKYDFLAAIEDRQLKFTERCASILNIVVHALRDITLFSESFVI